MTGVDKLIIHPDYFQFTGQQDGDCGGGDGDDDDDDDDGDDDDDKCLSRHLQNPRKLKKLPAITP